MRGQITSRRAVFSNQGTYPNAGRAGQRKQVRDNTALAQLDLMLTPKYNYADCWRSSTKARPPRSLLLPKRRTSRVAKLYLRIRVLSLSGGREALAARRRAVVGQKMKFTLLLLSSRKVTSSDRGPASAPNVPPKRNADAVVEEKTSSSQAALYR